MTTPSPHHGHIKSSAPAAQIRPAPMRPHHPGTSQATQTVGVNPDPPAERQTSGDVAKAPPYVGQSPTGYEPITIGAY